MRTEVPVFKRCCFFVPLRYGLLLWSYLKLVPTLLLLIGLYLNLTYSIVHFKDHEMFAVQYFIAFVIQTCNFLATFLLIIAAHKKSVKLLRIYYYCELVTAAATFTSLVLNFIMNISNDKIRGYLHMYPYLWKLIFLEILVWIIHVGVQLYVAAMVRSEILKLESKHQFRFINNAAEAECKYYEKHDIKIVTDGEDQTYVGERETKDGEGRTHGEESEIHDEKQTQHEE